MGTLDQAANQKKDRSELNYINGVPGLKISFNTFAELDATKAKAKEWMTANPEVVKAKELTVDRVMIGYISSHIENSVAAWVFDGRSHENQVATIGADAPNV